MKGALTSFLFLLVAHPLQAGEEYFGGVTSDMSLKFAIEGRDLFQSDEPNRQMSVSRLTIYVSALSKEWPNSNEEEMRKGAEEDHCYLLSLEGNRSITCAAGAKFGLSGVVYVEESTKGSEESESTTFKCARNCSEIVPTTIGRSDIESGC